MTCETGPGQALGVMSCAQGRGHPTVPSCCPLSTVLMAVLSTDGFCWYFSHDQKAPCSGFPNPMAWEVQEVAQ